MFHIVLYQPEIPPNTGNIIRLCANSGASLHLIHPLAFKLRDKNLRRAGLDYSDLVNVSEYDSLQNFVDRVKPNHLYACSTKGCTRLSSIRPMMPFCSGPKPADFPPRYSNNLMTVIFCVSPCSPVIAALTCPMQLPSPCMKHGASRAFTAAAHDGEIGSRNKSFSRK